MDILQTATEMQYQVPPVNQRNVVCMRFYLLTECTSGQLSGISLT
jgi:hypothetical protein